MSPVRPLRRIRASLLGEPRFEVYSAPDGWRFRLRAANGLIIAHGEAYTTARGARRGADAVRRAASGAHTVEVEA